MLELTTLEQAIEFFQSADFGEAAYRDLDLRSVAGEMLGLNFGASLFLGCLIDPSVVCQLANGGAYLINDMEGMTFPVHRASLYRAEELFSDFDPDDKESYWQTLDHRIYLQYRESSQKVPESIQMSLAQRLHDHSITEALDQALEGRNIVAIMGGHGLERRDPGYFDVARIGQKLTQAGYLVVSGGGPGAMEAAHVGAFFATREETTMKAAIDSMASRPENAPARKEYADWDWLHRAWRMRQNYSIPLGDEEKCQSIGIPTWTYGHEPPAVFASHIAKYFANSVREDGLLMVANHGVIYTAGSAGTIQEIFQDACQNHYFVANGQCSPMVFFGKEYWTKIKPVWPLLCQLAEGQRYEELLYLTDEVDTVVRKIQCYQPELYRRAPDH